MIGYLDGYKTNSICNLYQKTIMMTPNDLRFFLLCKCHNISVADAVGMIAAMNIASIKKRDTMIMCDFLEGYIQFIKDIVSDDVSE